MKFMLIMRATDEAIGNSREKSLLRHKAAVLG